jgi:hypothetical protein
MLSPKSTQDTVCKWEKDTEEEDGTQDIPVSNVSIDSIGGVTKEARQFWVESGRLEG